eukprot:233971-Pelagomonas_calceolata.AAC.1
MGRAPQDARKSNLKSQQLHGYLEVCVPSTGRVQAKGVILFGDILTLQRKSRGGKYMIVNTCPIYWPRPGKGGGPGR